VIGVPHPDLGEATVALLKASAPEVDQKFVLDAIAEQLARFKQPRQILIMDALPRNAMGKIQKAALRQRFANLFASEA
jgi:malonyl-CoA/methylmalonyl-CoA synthetase